MMTAAILHFIGGTSWFLAAIFMLMAGQKWTSVMFFFIATLNISAGAVLLYVAP